MGIRTALQKNMILRFPGMECVIDSYIGRGSNSLVYTGHYRDHQNPDLSHRVLIRELFPYEPAGGICRNADGSVFVEPGSLKVLERVY